MRKIEKQFGHGGSLHTESSPEEMALPTEDTEAIPERSYLVQKETQDPQQAEELSRINKDIEKLIIDSNFEKQYDTDLELKIEGAEPIPYISITPEKLLDERWVVLVGGFATDKTVYQLEMQSLTGKGRRIVFMNPERGVPSSKQENDFFDGSTATVPKTIRDKAAAVRALMNTLGIAKADIVGHSQGAAITAALAGAHPELCSHILLENPAGIYSQPLRKLIGGAIKELINERKREKTKSVNRPARPQTMLQRVLTHLPWRLTKEVPGAAQVSILPILEEIQRADKTRTPENQVEITILNSNKDQLFSADNIESSLTPNPDVDDATEILTRADTWAMYADKENGHGKAEVPGSGLTEELLRKDKIATVITQILTRRKAA
jgi:pimeloyl-ACP methyl ester carboxylesterase